MYQQRYKANKHRIDVGKEPSIVKVFEYTANKLQELYEESQAVARKDDQTWNKPDPYQNARPATIEQERKYLESNFQKIDLSTFNKPKTGLVPPPFKYLGPGNTLNVGPAYNSIDEDAKVHDIQYSQATREEHIFDSDKEFLKKAGDHFIEGISGKGTISDTIGSVVGLTGIGVKNSIEKHTGVIYPSNLSGKQWHLHQNDQNILIMEIN